MMFWKSPHLLSEIFEKPFKPLQLITNSKTFFQDSRYYERSKNFAGFQPLLKNLSLYLTNLIPYKPLSVKPLYPETFNVWFVIPIGILRTLFIYPPPYPQSQDYQTLRSGGSRKYYQTLQHKRHYEEHIFFPGFQNIYQTFIYFFVGFSTFFSHFLQVLYRVL